MFIFSFIIFLISCVPEKISILPNGAERIEVSLVYDGDTFKDTSGIVYRVIGIDTPEVHTNTKPKGEFAQEAKEFLQDYVSKNDIYVLKMGEDVYGRALAYVFGVDESGSVTFYEEEVTKEGLARPLIYEENAIDEYIERIVDAYRYAYEERKGIFSKWETAPVIDDPSEVDTHVGSIVWLEFHVNDVHENSYLYILDGEWAEVIIRKDGFEYTFDDFNPYSFKGKRIRVYGELWKYGKKAEILLRAVFEILPSE